MPVMHSLYRESGSVTIDRETCIECGECSRVCPSGVIDKLGGHVIIRLDSPFGCIACGHCMMVCPQGSVKVNGRGLLPSDIVPLPPRGERASCDQLHNLFKARRSVRRFSKRSVEPALISRIVEMASSAPMGIPPWDIGCVVVNDRNKVRELARELVGGYGQFLKIFRPWVLRLTRPFIKRTTYEQFASFILPLAKSYVTAWHEGRDKLFYGAPSVIIFHHSPYCEASEAMIPCTYAMLAAESLGLGTTIIGGAAPVLQRNSRLCSQLGIPRGNKPAVALIVGHPAVRFRTSVRRHFSSVSMNGFDGARANFPAPRKETEPSFRERSFSRKR